MRAHQRLVLLAGASGAVLILLGHMAHRAAEQLLEVPPQSWGLSELSDAIVAGTCAFGTLGALWHVISALLALSTGGQASRGLGSTRGQAHHRFRTARLPVLGAGTGRRGDRRRGRPRMAPHQLGARLPTVAVLDAVASSRPTGSGGD